MTGLKKLIMLNGMIQKTAKTIGGIYVLVNNVRIYDGGDITTKAVSDDSYFVTGVYDTGTTDKKAYVVTRWRGMPERASLRVYNTDDITMESVDYWSVCEKDDKYGTYFEYKFESTGRYIICAIPKVFASQFWLKYENGDYIFKGNDVT